MSPLLALAMWQVGSPAVDTGQGGVLVTLPSLAVPMRDSATAPEIFIAPELRNEAIYLCGRFDSPAQLRSLIARAASAEWVKSGSGLRLERSAAMRKRLRDEERATLLADLKIALPKESPTLMTEAEYARLKEVVSRWGIGESEAEKEKNNNEARKAQMAMIPESRNAHRFGAALNPEKLADLLVGQEGELPLRLLGNASGSFARLPLDGDAFLSDVRTERRVIGASEPVVQKSPAQAASERWRAQALARGELGVMIGTKLGGSSITFTRSPPTARRRFSGRAKSP